MMTDLFNDFDRELSTWWDYLLLLSTLLSFEERKIGGLFILSLTALQEALLIGSFSLLKEWAGLAMEARIVEDAFFINFGLSYLHYSIEIFLNSSIFLRIYYFVFSNLSHSSSLILLRYLA